MVLAFFTFQAFKRSRGLLDNLLLSQSVEMHNYYVVQDLNQKSFPSTVWYKKALKAFQSLSNIEIEKESKINFLITYMYNTRRTFSNSLKLHYSIKALTD